MATRSRCCRPSAGADMPVNTPVDLKLLDMPFEPDEALSDFRRTHQRSGAVASFLGVVRARDGVEELELTDYYPLTRTSMLDHAVMAWKRFPLDGLLVWHRKGLLRPGESIVLVAVAAQHRRAAFDAMELLTDHLKSATWFWKRERRGNEWHWVQPTDEDRELLERWGR